MKPAILKGCLTGHASSQNLEGGEERTADLATASYFVTNLPPKSFISVRNHELIKLNFALLPRTAWQTAVPQRQHQRHFSFRRRSVGSLRAFSERIMTKNLGTSVAAEEEQDHHYAKTCFSLFRHDD